MKADLGQDVFHAGVGGFEFLFEQIGVLTDAFELGCVLVYCLFMSGKAYTVDFDAFFLQQVEVLNDEHQDIVDLSVPLLVACEGFLLVVVEVSRGWGGMGADELYGWQVSVRLRETVKLGPKSMPCGC